MVLLTLYVIDDHSPTESEYAVSVIDLLKPTMYSSEYNQQFFRLRPDKEELETC